MIIIVKYKFNLQFFNMNITFSPLIPDTISFLCDSKGLYLLDFRAIGESMDYDIPAMRKYENLLPWVVSWGQIIVNQYAQSLNYVNQNKLIEVSYENYSPKVSLCKRMQEISLDLSNHDIVCSFIPHPDVDEYCKISWKKNFYSFEDFQIYNNKLKQKRYMWGLGSTRGILDASKDYRDQLPNARCYIKREYGSGWYTVFDSLWEQTPSPQDLNDGHRWYWELYAPGKVMSIQCLKIANNISIFGWIEQQIVENRHFAWWKFLSIEGLSKSSLGIKAKDCLARLEPLLSDYNWFFGIDFIVSPDGEEFTFLEANVRLTAMTIPTLLHNQNPKRTTFTEDCDINWMSDYLLLTYDHSENTWDILLRSPKDE